MKKNTIIKIFLSICFIFTSCASDNIKRNVVEKIDYTNEMLVQNEIERIRQLKKSEPVRALWRSYILNSEEIIAECTENVKEYFVSAMENKNYFDALRFYNSLKCAGIELDQGQVQELVENYYGEVPAVNKINEKRPLSVNDCLNATVTVWVDRGIKFQNGYGTADAILGSGFFIDKRGYLVTNHHVISSMVDPKYEGFSRLYVKLLSDPDTRIPAKVVGYDSVLDLALLKVEIEPEFVLDLGSSEKLKVGEKILAIGSPIGLEGTITSGIISSTERKLTTLGTYFQLDAAVNSGNSGGPLIDELFKVQAVVFAGIPLYQGLNFAIPIEYLKQELSLMYNEGEVVHSWLGAFGRTYREGNKKQGLEVLYTMPGSSSDFAGLKMGCVITEVDGNPIKSFEDFQFLMMKYLPGTMIRCKYQTELGEDAEQFFYLETRPENPSYEIYKTDLVDNSFIPLYGMQLIPNSTSVKNSYKVTKVLKGSPAEESSFSEEDTVRIISVKVDKNSKYIMAQLGTNRKKKAFLEFGMVLIAGFDSPYYF